MLNVRLLAELLGEALRFVSSYLRSGSALRRENIFLRRQLAMFVERGAVPRRPVPADRLVLAIASRCFAWRNALIVVKPATLVRWQREGFRLFWRWKSRAGRRPLGRELRELIRTMARQNPSWGERRVADELLVKLGIRVSPRTVRKYWPPELRPRRGSRHDHQRWSTFMGNHARGFVACDFVLVATLRFQLLYVLLVMEPGSRRLLHTNVTAHPTAGWTTQRLLSRPGPGAAHAPAP